MNAAQLTGRADTHVVDAPECGCTLHVDVRAAFHGLRREAAMAGFDLFAVSGFRGFERQLAIWNDKFSGRRPALDRLGRRIDLGTLAAAERVETILAWSALPGASRHHWGTDLDLADRRAIPPGHRLQLIPEEFAPDGPFALLVQWLDTHAARFGFFRPYRGGRSGVRPEPWHYSFAPVAEFARRRLTVGVLREAIDTAPLLGKAEVLANLDDYHARYVAAIDWP